MSHWQCPADIARREGDFIAGPFQPIPALHKWWQVTSHWQSMVLGPDSAIHLVDAVPDEACSSGIYMLFAEDDSLLYTGKSTDISARICAHYRKQRFGQGIPFTHFAFLPLPLYAVSDVEVAHIFALEPPYNHLYERIRWDQHEAMVEHIKTVWGPKR